MLQRWVDPTWLAIGAATTALAVIGGYLATRRAAAPVAADTTPSAPEKKAPKAMKATTTATTTVAKASAATTATTKRPAKAPSKPPEQVGATGAMPQRPALNAEQKRRIADLSRRLVDGRSGAQADGVDADIVRTLDQAQALLDGAAGSSQAADDIAAAASLLGTAEAELQAFFDEQFTPVGKSGPRAWTVAEFEGATGGRKAKFKSLVDQGLITPGDVFDQYHTSYEASGGFATAIRIEGAPNTEIHTHYSPNDELKAAHFKPSADRYTPGHALNSLTPAQQQRFVDEPMQDHYGGPPPWGRRILRRKP